MLTIRAEIKKGERKSDGTYNVKLRFTHQRKVKRLSTSLFVRPQDLIGGKIYFDEVSCKLKGSDAEMVVNGNFEDNDLSNWAVLSYAGQSMSIKEMDNPLDISIVSIEGTQKFTKDIYDLQGRIVNNGQLKKGIYIINGKKVIR